jgi:putative membrane protein
MMHGYGFGSSMFMGGGIFMFIFWILIAVVIISMFSGRFTGNSFKSGVDRKETPMDILKKRYARGEITESEYKDMKDKLRD